MFIAGPHQLYAAIIRPALTNKGCMYVCMYRPNATFHGSIAEYPATDLHKNSVYCILTRSSHFTADGFL